MVFSCFVESLFLGFNCRISNFKSIFVCTDQDIDIWNCIYLISYYDFFFDLFNDYQMGWPPRRTDKDNEFCLSQTKKVTMEYSFLPSSNEKKNKSAILVKTLESSPENHGNVETRHPTSRSLLKPCNYQQVASVLPNCVQHDLLKFPMFHVFCGSKETSPFKKQPHDYSC